MKAYFFTEMFCKSKNKTTIPKGKPTNKLINKPRNKPRSKQPTNQPTNKQTKGREKKSYSLGLEKLPYTFNYP